MSIVRQTLGDICDAGGGEIKTGPFGSQLHQSDYVDEGTPVVMPKNIVLGKVEVADIARIGSADVERLSRHRLRVGDIVYGRRGDIGRRAFITEKEADWLCGTGSMRIRLGDGPVSPLFLHYYLGDEQVIGWIRNQAVGATMPNLNTSILRSVPISYPMFPTQYKIASILSAYDDLIENNLRRIRILEEMAQNLYREWFVKFRFTGHENVCFVDSPLGSIPEGWEVQPVEELLAKHIGGGWGKEEPDEKHILPAHVIRGTDIPKVKQFEVGAVPFRYHTESNLKSRKLKADDLIFEVSGGGKEQPVGRIMRVSERLLEAFPGDIICASFCKRMSPAREKIHPEVLALHLQALYESPRINKYQVQSTGIKNLKFSVFLEQELVVVPTSEIQSAISEVLEPLCEQRDCLAKQSVNARRTRDLLLPRLISGELDVSELDITVEENDTL